MYILKISLENVAGILDEYSISMEFGICIQIKWKSIENIEKSYCWHMYDKLLNRTDLIV